MGAAYIAHTEAIFVRTETVNIYIYISNMHFILPFEYLYMDGGYSFFFVLIVRHRHYVAVPFSTAHRSIGGDWKKEKKI